MEIGLYIVVFSLGFGLGMWFQHSAWLRYIANYTDERDS